MSGSDKVDNFTQMEGKLAGCYQFWERETPGVCDKNRDTLFALTSTCV